MTKNFAKIQGRYLSLISSILICTSKVYYIQQFLTEFNTKYFQILFLNLATALALQDVKVSLLKF